MLLGGAPPAIIQGNVVGRHQHTWKLREHYLLSAEMNDADSGVDLEIDDAPLRAGDPLRSYFPTGAQLTEHRDGVTVHDTQTGQVHQYRRPSPSGSELPVRDIIVTGEVSILLQSLFNPIQDFRKLISMMTIGAFGLGPI
jgi:hypothetical protein